MLHSPLMGHIIIGKLLLALNWVKVDFSLFSNESRIIPSFSIHLLFFLSNSHYSFKDKLKNNKSSKDEGLK